MNCPTCRQDASKVIRTIDLKTEIVRHRRCDSCGHRWPTREIPDAALEHDREVVAKARELAQVVGEG